jgi:hypothetical protein
MPDILETDLTRKPPVFLGHQLSWYAGVVAASVIAGVAASEGHGLEVFLAALMSGVCASVAWDLAAAFLARAKR